MLTVVLFQRTVIRYNEKCGSVEIKHIKKTIYFFTTSNCQYHNCKTMKGRGDCIWILNHPSLSLSLSLFFSYDQRTGIIQVYMFNVFLRWKTKTTLNNYTYRENVKPCGNLVLLKE